ncbi:MAG: ACT domain-containing protein [Methanocellales archaeon]|nr:ACT domain-containing protein [Methanocellales archaeon]MDD3421023.1 ACT domain-containing protein [Methanocellales archaeon]MDD4898500.1 ACT domain-containing protein [Methanocellales archaeon]MDD5447147.1 ACT domain-containing protein [Methanocellales archaeon]
MEKERAIITVNGVDHPGIIATITNVLADMDINIEDLSQTVLQDLFTMIMIVDLKGADIIELQDKLSKTGAKQGVRITVQHENIFKYMHRV